MSCYGKERGTITIPSKEFKSYKDNMLNSYQSKMTSLYESAVIIYKEMKALKLKGKVQCLSGREFECTRSYYAKYLLEKSILKEGRLVSPKKKDFVVKKENDRLVMDDDELTVIINLKEKSVTYHSDDNNRSIETARNSFLGRLFFREINKVQFTNRSGGYLKSITEYDDEFNGGRYSFTCGKYKNPKYLD